MTTLKQGSRSDLSQNETSKGFKDIGNVINESRTGTHRILKLNDLIPELQELVSQGKKRTKCPYSNRQNGGLIKTVDDVREVFGDSE